MRLRDRIGVSNERQRQLSWFLQVGLVGMLFIGLERGSPGIIVNCAVGLAVAQLPAVLEQDYEITLDPALSLWITAAVFLHALGTVGLPGAEQSFYRGTSWWDHMTHALSSSVVAGAGYVTVRAIDRHSDEIHLPRRFMFVFILMFVIAFGVAWEILEFSLGFLKPLTGGKGILAQYSLEDTMMDLVYNTIGGLIVATWGTAHLTDTVGAIQARLETREMK